ncbi:MAG: hypothetical protein LBN74_02335 [Prevotella sp.]|nr:hypothetical protein [Prevotella sp.]
MTEIQACLIAIAGVAGAYFENTDSFVYACLLAFSVNIFAGFRADHVGISFKMRRLVNFEGNKLKDSFKELFLILGITFLIKSLMDFMNLGEKSVYAVQILIAIALYYYIRNSLRNLHRAYPKIKWISVIYYLIAFEFKKLMPDSVNEAMDAADKDDNEKQNEHG